MAGGTGLAGGLAWRRRSPAAARLGRSSLPVRQV